MMTIEQNAQASIEKLMLELAHLRSQNAKLRRRLGGSAGSATIERAARDAHLLIMSAFSDGKTGRRAMEGLGLSRRRWQWAVALLRIAGVVADKANQQSGLVWQVRSLDQAVCMFEASSKDLLSRPNGYQMLRAKLRA